MNAEPDASSGPHEDSPRAESSRAETRADQVTQILGSHSSPRAAADLLPLVYDELRELARARMARERPDMTLQATALVHEAYLRLVGQEDPGWGGRGHFFGAAAQAMRRILIEQGRRKGRLKHGADRHKVALQDAAIGVANSEARDLEGEIAIAEAVEKLQQLDARKAQLLDLRYFAGLSAEEAAQALEVSLGTVEREWRFIKAWLKDELADGPTS